MPERENVDVLDSLLCVDLMSNFCVYLFQTALSMFLQDSSIPTCRTCNGNHPNTNYPVSVFVHHVYIIRHFVLFTEMV